MKLWTEINRLTIFCFCLLTTSLSKSMTVFSQLEDKSTELFKTYNTCWSLSQGSPLHTDETMEGIPDCSKFDQKVLESYYNASCVFLSILSKNKNSLCSLCNNCESKNLIVANIEQLKILIDKVQCNCPQQKEMTQYMFACVEKLQYFYRVFRQYNECMKQMKILSEH